MKRCGWLLLLLWVSCSVSAYKYTGRVFDKQTGEPLPFTHIYDHKGKLLTLSDEKGFFSIENHEKDSVRVSASSIGYSHYYMAFSRESKQLLVALTPMGQELGTVVIEGKRSSININQPYTQSTVYASNIEETVSSSPIDVLETLPWVSKNSE